MGMKFIRTYNDAWHKLFHPPVPKREPGGTTNDYNTLVRINVLFANKRLST